MVVGHIHSAFNRRHKLCGHLFSGRYKALIVEGSGNGYLKTVCDYVHLNPVRARLLAPEEPLQSYRWSSYRHYALREKGIVEIESEWTARDSEQTACVATARIFLRPG